jgi:hypothetical protein
MSTWPDEETDEPLLADHRNFYKVEKWTGRHPGLSACSTPATTWIRRGAIHSGDQASAADPAHQPAADGFAAIPKMRGVKDVMTDDVHADRA